MNYKKLDQLIKKVEDCSETTTTYRKGEHYSKEDAYYTYRKGEHYICNNDGEVLNYKGIKMKASSLDELLKLGGKAYKAGQLFKLGSDIFLLAQVSFGKYSLIDVKMGNRMNEGVFVNDCHAITEEELKLMACNAKGLIAIDSLKDA